MSRTSVGIAVIFMWVVYLYALPTIDNVMGISRAYEINRLGGCNAADKTIEEVIDCLDNLAGETIAGRDGTYISLEDEKAMIREEIIDSGGSFIDVWIYDFISGVLNIDVNNPWSIFTSFWLILSLTMTVLLASDFIPIFRSGSA